LKELLYMYSIFTRLMDFDYVIVGNGIAGASAAENLRKEDENGSILIVTEEDKPLYNRILIKEVAKGNVPIDATQIHSSDWYEEHDINLWLDTRVVEVDTDESSILTDDERSVNFGKLLVASGGTPKNLPVENSEAEGIYTFWTHRDATVIKNSLRSAKSAVIIGAGLLGLDIAAAAGAHAVDAKYLMRGNRWWRYAVSEEGAEIVHEGLRDIGVEPVFGCGVRRFETDNSGRVNAVIDTNGNYHSADFVGLAIGLNYNTEFLVDTDVELDNGVVVDEHLQTSVDNVYAAGDVAQYFDIYLQRTTQNGSWDSAKCQGEIAAMNMASSDGNAHRFELVPTYSISHFDFGFLSIGHPTEGDTTKHRRYDESSYRQLAFFEDRLVGSVLIGGLKSQLAIKKVIESKLPYLDRFEDLFDPNFSVEDVCSSE